MVVKAPNIVWQEPYVFWSERGDAVALVILVAVPVAIVVAVVVAKQITFKSFPEAAIAAAIAVATIAGANRSLVRIVKERS